jgi:hypothetical protein
MMPCPVGSADLAVEEEQANGQPQVAGEGEGEGSVEEDRRAVAVGEAVAWEEGDLTKVPPPPPSPLLIWMPRWRAT